jgi:hypothetical protein
MKQLFTYFAFFFGFFFAFGTDITRRPKVAIAGLTLPAATKFSHMYRTKLGQNPLPRIYLPAIRGFKRGPEANSPHHSNRADFSRHRLMARRADR